MTENETKFQAALFMQNSKHKLLLAKQLAERTGFEVGTTIQVLNELAKMEAEVRVLAWNAPSELCEPKPQAYPLYWMNAIAEQKTVRKIKGNKRPLRIVRVMDRAVSS
jgi:hypothetical protein